MKPSAHLIAALIATGTLPLTAQTFTWNGNGGDDFFGTGANWIDGNAPGVGSGVVLSFDGSTRPTPDNNYTTGDNFGEWRLAATAGADFTITGNGFGLFSKIENDAGSNHLFTINTAGIYARSNIEINPVGGNIVVDTPIYLDDNRSLDVYDGGNGNTLNLNGILSQGNGNGGSGSLVLNQSASVILAADGNTYGATGINTGTTLRVGAGGATGSLGSGAVTNDGSLIFNRTGSLTVSNGISGSGSVAVQMGTVSFNNQKTYTGNTTVNGGILDLTGGAGQDGTIRGSVTIHNGGTLRLSVGDATGWGTGAQRITAINIKEGGTLNINTTGNQTFSNLALTLQGGTISGVAGSNFDFFNGASSLNTLASATQSIVSMNARLRQANTTFDIADGAAAVDLLWSGQLNQEGTGRNFIKTGAGRMNLAGAASYSGTTTVNGGYLAVSNTMLNTSSITVNNGATLELGATNMFVGGHGTAVPNSRVITVNASNLLMNASMDSRIGNITLNNGSTWTSNRGLGAWDVLLANTTTGAATVTVGGSGASAMNGTGGIHLQGQQNFNIAETTGNANADLVVSMRLDNAGNAGGAAGALNKLGAGTMHLTAINTYTGGTTVNEGVLSLGVGGSSGIIRGTATVNDGATLRLAGNDATGYGTGSDRLHTINMNGGMLEITTTGGGGQNQTLGSAAIHLTGGSLVMAHAGSNLDFFAGSSSLNSLASSTTSTVSGGNLSIRQTAGLTITTAAGTTPSGIDLLISSVIRSDGGFSTAPLTKAGDGVLQLSASNTFTGNLTINGGVLELSPTGKLYNGGFNNAAVITVNAGGTWRMPDYSYGGVGQLADYAQRRVLDGGSIEVTGNSHSSGQDFTVTDQGGTFRYTPSGQTLTLSGNNNTNIQLDGTLTFDAIGDIAVSGNSAIIQGAGGLTKTGDGTLTLAAAHTYTGATTVSAGTLLVTGALGNTAVTVGSSATIGGNGTLGGSLALEAGSFLDLTGATIGFASSGILTVSGAITLTDFSFGNLVGWNPAAADLGTYTLINGGSVTLAGTTPTAASPFDFGNGKQAYFQQGSLQVVVVPEPAAALLGTLGLLALLRRRSSA